MVDDTEVLRSAIETILQLEGYLVVTADNGLGALDALAHGEYCLILLDIAMPIMDGFEFLKAYDLQLRSHSPVIIISGEENIQLSALPSFVMDVISKPFDISHLLQAVEKYAQPV